MIHRHQISQSSNEKTAMPLPRRGNVGRSRCPQTSRDTLFFFSIVGFVVFIFCIEISLFNHVDIYQETNNMSVVSSRLMTSYSADDIPHISLPSHLLPHVPILPLFNSISHAEDKIASLMDGRASMVGVVALLQKFLSELHNRNQEASKTEADGNKVLDNFFHLTEKYIKPFDNAYQGRHIFPLREDGSIFISIAAFREGFLLETLVSAFKNAKNPEKVFVGAVVQNCFGKILEDGTLETSGTPCFSARKTIGEDETGKDIKGLLEIPVDKNGIEAFCAMPDYEHYCKNGQIRVLYVHHIDGQGPSMARYYASKLWGGENYFMQIDSHLRFAREWDAKYITESKLTLNYPKSVLSAYPPGFDQVRFIPKHMGVDKSKINNDTVIESPGCRLCGCGTPGEAKPGKELKGIIHIGQTKSYEKYEIRPKQSPFIGAGLVFAHGDFLKDVPFDPYLPWTFMGEEILLSMRAWTHGWNIYSPRKNLIIHQYRPAKLGFPKFYASIQSLYKKFGNAWLQKHTIRRIKNLCGYPFHTAEKIEADDQSYVLADIENYGLGTARSWEDYLEFTQIKVNYTTGALDCSERLDWCLDALKD